MGVNIGGAALGLFLLAIGLMNMFVWKNAKPVAMWGTGLVMLLAGIAIGGAGGGLFNRAADLFLSTANRTATALVGAGSAVALAVVAIVSWHFLRASWHPKKGPAVTRSVQWCAFAAPILIVALGGLAAVSAGLLAAGNGALSQFGAFLGQF